MSKKAVPVITFIIIMMVILFSRGFTTQWLLNLGIESYSGQLTFSIGVNIVITLISLYYIKKHQLQELAGIGNSKLRNIGLLFFPAYLILINLDTNLVLPEENLWLNISMLLLYCFSIGFAEELSIRGFIQSYFIKHYGTSKPRVIWSVVGASLIFGFLHLIKFNKGIYGELSQVCFATFIGVMFGVLLLRTKRIAPLIILHALIDFAAKIDDVGQIKNSSSHVSMEGAIILALVVLPCLIYGVVLTKKLKI